MDKDYIFAMVCILIMGTGGFGVLAFSNHIQAQVQIACYDAMKHNPNIKECGNIK
jgi:hypothetical protein